MRQPSVIASELDEAFVSGKPPAELYTLIRELRAAIEAAGLEMTMVAKLASTEPRFFNPIKAMETGVVRDQILSELREAKQ